jgi:hypothetical protein
VLGECERISPQSIVARHDLLRLHDAPSPKWRQLVQDCSFCGRMRWVSSDDARISICRQCAAKLGRFIAIIGRSSRRFWRFRRAGLVSASPDQGRAIVGLPKELRLDELPPKDLIQDWDAPQYRVSGLGFYAAHLLRSARPSALGLRVAAAFLASVEAEYATLHGLVQRATESCITALFDSNLFRFEQFEALRDEIRSGL